MFAGSAAAAGKLRAILASIGGINASSVSFSDVCCESARGVSAVSSCVTLSASDLANLEPSPDTSRRRLTPAVSSEGMAIAVRITVPASLAELSASAIGLPLDPTLSPADNLRLRLNSLGSALASPDNATSVALFTDFAAEWSAVTGIPITTDDLAQGLAVTSVVGYAPPADNKAGSRLGQGAVAGIAVGALVAVAAVVAAVVVVTMRRKRAARAQRQRPDYQV